MKKPHSSTEMLRIPVTATMRQMPDGSYKMANATYQEFAADAFAQMLLRAFGKTPLTASTARNSPPCATE